MRSDKLFLALSLVVGGLLWQPAHAQQTSLVSAVLPASRAVQVGTSATAFATVINGGTVTATGCQIGLPAGLAADFYYQATDAATNAPIAGLKNVPVNIGPGQAQSFLIAVTPQSTFAAQDIGFKFGCTNAADAPVYAGLNTLLLSSSATPGPDVVALAATVNGDGIVDVPGATGTGFFAVATVNVGTAATITASASTGGTALPLTLSICQTNPTTGSCLAAPAATVSTSIGAGATPTFAVFATASGSIPFDPAGNRILVVFRDAAGAVKGATSVAVRTTSAPAPNAAPVANAGLAQSVTTGSTVTLDGSASSDVNGDALTFAWTLSSKPAGSAATLAGATTARPTFLADLAGTYVATLVVNDGKVNSTPATVSVTASAPPPAVVGYYLYGGLNYSVYLGCLNCNQYSSESVCNAYGTYGSAYSSSSIWNQYGTYGSPYNSYSPWNQFSSSGVPMIVGSDNRFYGYFTINPYNANRTTLSPFVNWLNFYSAYGNLAATRSYACGN